MIDITTHIRELLFRHDCVILPSFGGFIGNYRPAGIDNSTNTFTPPVKAISFNRNLKHNDGLLIGKISETRKIGYADSKRLVDDFVNSLQKRLEKGERVTLNRIGYFQNNSEGSLQFEPDRESNYLLDAYGLESFNREPVENYDVARRVMKRNDMEPVTSSISRKMVWRAVIAVPFIAAMILVPLKTDLFKNRISINPLAGIELNEGNEIPDHAPTSQVSGTSDAQGVRDDNATGDNRGFFLIAGSFKSADNALRLFDKMSLQGHEAELIKAPNGFYRVSIESYETYSMAVTEKKNLLSEYPEIWIWKK